MKKERVSLFDVAFSKKEMLVKENTDERVIVENNKIMSRAYGVLSAILTLFALLMLYFNNIIVLQPSLILGIIGIISYISLVNMCKKGIVDGNTNISTLFIVGIINCPLFLSIYMSKIFSSFAGIWVIVAFVLIIILYKIANNIYKKNRI